MNESNRATRAILKKMAPLDALSYINSFSMPLKHERLMYYLYVKKLDMFSAIDSLENDKVYLSWRTACRIHKQALDWITSSLA